jgi:hypothetical protein
MVAARMFDTRTINFEVKRPNRMQVEIRSPHSERGFWYEGHALTILDRKQNLFSTAVMPGTLDAALDEAHDRLGIDLPLIELWLVDYLEVPPTIQQFTDAAVISKTTSAKTLTAPSPSAEYRSGFG